MILTHIFDLNKYTYEFPSFRKVDDFKQKTHYVFVWRWKFN
jgi:hypothetical protein